MDVVEKVRFSECAESCLSFQAMLSDFCVLCFVRTINSGSLESVNTRNWVLIKLQKMPLEVCVRYVRCV